MAQILTAIKGDRLLPGSSWPASGYLARVPRTPAAKTFGDSNSNTDVSATQCPKIAILLGCRSGKFGPKKDTESEKLGGNVDESYLYRTLVISVIYGFGGGDVTVTNVKSSVESGKSTLKIRSESGKLLTIGCRFPAKLTNFGTLEQLANRALTLLWILVFSAILASSGVSATVVAFGFGMCLQQQKVDMSDTIMAATPAPRGKRPLNDPGMTPGRPRHDPRTTTE